MSLYASSIERENKKDLSKEKKCHQVTPERKILVKKSMEFVIMILHLLLSLVIAISAVINILRTAILIVFIYKTRVVIDVLSIPLFYIVALDCLRNKVDILPYRVGNIILSCLLFLFATYRYQYIFQQILVLLKN